MLQKQHAVFYIVTYLIGQTLRQEAVAAFAVAGSGCAIGKHPDLSMFGIDIYYIKCILGTSAGYSCNSGVAADTGTRAMNDMDDRNTLAESMLALMIVP